MEQGDVLPRGQGQAQGSELVTTGSAEPDAWDLQRVHEPSHEEEVPADRVDMVAVDHALQTRGQEALGSRSCVPHDDHVDDTSEAGTQ